MTVFQQDKSEIKKKVVLMKNEAIVTPNKNIQEMREKLIIRHTIDIEILIRTKQIREYRRAIKRNILHPEEKREITNIPVNIVPIEMNIGEEKSKDKADTEMIEAILRREIEVIEATIMSTKAEETTVDRNLDLMKDLKKDLDLTIRTDITMTEIESTTTIRTIKALIIEISIDDDIFYIL